MTVYNFISYAFKEDFSLKQLPSDWIQQQDYKVKTLASNGGQIFAYSFGALTFVNVHSTVQSIEIDILRKSMKEDLTEGTTTEDFIVEVDPTSSPKVEFHRLLINELNPGRISVIALILAQSASLEYFESLVTKIKTKTLAINTELYNTGKLKVSLDNLHKLAAETMLIRGEVVGVLHLLDKPDIIWEDKVMDSLYDGIKSTFELGDRFKVIEQKLEATQDDIELLMGMMHNKRAHRAEISEIALSFTITILILFEIVMAFK
jgi:uncharacterized Rmd1/YagE family protein